MDAQMIALALEHKEVLLHITTVEVEEIPSHRRAGGSISRGL